MNECAGEKESGRASHDAHISKSRYGAPGTRHPADGQYHLLTLVEEANACDAGRSGFEAGGSVFKGDATQRVDRDRCGCEAGGAKLIQSLAGSDVLAGNDFLEDRGEDDGVSLIGNGIVYVFQGVAGDGNDWGRGVG